MVGCCLLLCHCMGIEKHLLSIVVSNLDVSPSWSSFSNEWANKMTFLSINGISNTFLLHSSALKNCLGTCLNIGHGIRILGDECWLRRLWDSIVLSSSAISCGALRTAYLLVLKLWIGLEPKWHLLAPLQSLFAVYSSSALLKSQPYCALLWRTATT